MASDYATELKDLRERIRAGGAAHYYRDENGDYLGGKDRSDEELTDDDRENLLKFDQQLALLDSEYGEARRVKLLRHCTIMAEKVGGLTEALTDREAAEPLVAYANSYKSVETRRDYRVALRMFGTRVLKRDPDEDGPPDSLAWIKTGLPKNHDPTPSRADMLDDEDVDAMIEQGARNFREKALFATQYEAGLRGQELYDLTVGDVVDDENGVYIHVDNGKTGTRDVLCIGDAVAYLADWLEHEHPAPTNGDAPLWSKLGTPERASYQTFLKYFKRAAKRAGVSKTVTPTNFRKSNAYDLARRGFNAALIEDRQGRKRGSEAVARYIGRFGRESDEQYLGGHGVEQNADPAEDPRPVECVRCGKKTPRNKGRCANCRLPFDPKEAYEAGIESGDATPEELVEQLLENEEAQTQLVDALAERAAESGPINTFQTYRSPIDDDTDDE
ncbi:tyrosine-type recombinase/integrase [Halapricum hydrolyticum]|uniref:Site-specific integrase n=1 Tax=Halapricum hydrolyticum TaxID=2979991 RepID=A0AAE3I997_9EURY|nr:tyrosine-type recombinase/integrase [Halapricum hydrolyticum]MCU4716624.1 site-specific integrase [Halapricum hydrolyticum]MCU4725771.1 site-specific integrase [Halapricum hydrolyticum]